MALLENPYYSEHTGKEFDEAVEKSKEVIDVNEAVKKNTEDISQLALKVDELKNEPAWSEKSKLLLRTILRASVYVSDQNDNIDALIESIVGSGDAPMPPTPPTPSLVATPVITMNGSSASITCDTDGANIYYTIDGSTPTTSINLYVSSVALVSGQTLKAVAIKDGVFSDIISYTYSSSDSMQELDVEILSSRYALTNDFAYSGNYSCSVAIPCEYGQKFELINYFFPSGSVVIGYITKSDGSNSIILNSAVSKEGERYTLSISDKDAIFVRFNSRSNTGDLKIYSDKNVQLNAEELQLTYGNYIWNNGVRANGSRYWSSSEMIECNAGDMFIVESSYSSHAIKCAEDDSSNFVIENNSTGLNVNKYLYIASGSKIAFMNNGESASTSTLKIYKIV